jgi:flavin-dependent dehydrogenase
MKVIIIGASAAGLFSAYLLAKEGREVEVFERTNSIGHPPRTLIVTSKINEVLDFIPEEAIVNRVRYLEVFSSTRSAKIELKSGDLVVERERLLSLLARLAERAGAQIKLNHEFLGFLRSGSKLVIQVKNLPTGIIYSTMSDILIGADGVSSTVAQTISQDGHFKSALLQAKVAIPQSFDLSTCQVWFVPERTKYFYWLIPESPGVATAGLIADTPQQARECLKIFLEEKGLTPREFQGALVPLHDLRKKVFWPGPGAIFLIGDAGAQVKVTTVGGVVTGLYGARVLVDFLLRRKNYGREMRRLKWELHLHLLLREVLNRFRDQDYDELIALLTGRLKRELGEWRRDELAVSFWKLFLAEPRIISLAAKAYLRSKIF